MGLPQTSRCDVLGLFDPLAGCLAQCQIRKSSSNLSAVTGVFLSTYHVR